MDRPPTRPASSSRDVEMAERGEKRSSQDDSSRSSILEPRPATPKVETAADEKEPDPDPDVVTWDGPDDPQNPMNWPNSKKWSNIAVLSVLSVITPLGSSLFAPGVARVMAEFHETSSTTATLIVSIYILGFAFGPLIAAPLSEIHGRRLLYNAGNLLFTIFSVGAALSNSIGMLMAFRFLMGLAGCVPITIGAGSIADFMPVEKRGGAMSVWAMGPLLGPCVGPIAGGYMIEAVGWRWSYWLMVILGGVCVPIAWFALRESYPPVLLEQKAQRLRKETGNMNLRAQTTTKGDIKEQFKLAIIRPLKLLVTEPPVTLMAFYVAIVYGVLYLMITTFSFVYAKVYHFSEGTVGLTFLPAGIGMIIGVGGFGVLTDAMVRRNKAKGLEHRPEIRLMPVVTIPSGLALPVGLFIYGWTIEKQVHWIVPMLGVVIFCIGLMGLMMSAQNYVVDSYLQYAASVIAAMTVLRSILGAFLPMAGLPMYNTLGYGWGNSLLAFLALAMVPIPLAFYMFGARLRQRSKPVV